MNRTTIDWWAFRTQAQPLEVVEGVRPAFGDAGQYVKLLPRGHGWQGYEQSADLVLADMPLGLLAYGGQAQRGWVHTSLNAKACEWITDWDRALEAAEALPAYDARRVDIALTTVDGSIRHEQVVEAYRTGGFALGGRPPKCRQILPEDPMDGRTIYVGQREHAKFFRGYEKGLELAAPFKAKGWDIASMKIDDKPVVDMYRLELELKAKNGELPADLIERRDQYFAGAYPYLQRVLAVEPEILTARRERQPQLDLAAALANVRAQYGATLYTALRAYQGDIGAVWDRVVGQQHNRALLEAGVLLVDHE